MNHRSWNEPFDGRRVLPAALLAAVIAVGVNVGLRVAGERWLAIPPDQPVLSYISVIAATLVGVLLATLAVTVLGQTQARPFTVFRRMAAVVFLVSCIGPLLAYAGWLPSVDTVSVETMGMLLAMNTATTIVCVAVFTTVPRAVVPRHRF